MVDDGLRSRNEIKISAHSDKFTRKGKRLRSLDNIIRITINGKTVVIDDLDVYIGKKPYIKIYGDIEFSN